MAFGQEVSLQVHTRDKKEVFASQGLRVDFDVRQIGGFSRANFKIFNVSETTIKSLNAPELYVTVTATLHGSSFVVAREFFISNVLDQRKLPSNVVTLYCIDKLRRDFLEKDVVGVIVKKPTLRREMKAILDHVEYKGDLSKSWSMFPEGKLDQGTNAPSYTHQGNLQQCIRELENCYGFTTFTDNGLLRFVYRPDSKDVQFTDLPTMKPDVVLEVRNMRADPIIGLATLNVTSNLDERIKPSAVLDVSNLLSAGTNSSQNTLEIAGSFLKDSVAGFPKYQALSVQHTGSNFTSTWHTIATCYSPTRGLTMPSLTWFKGI